MTDESLRDRDEDARDRDEASRERDEIARDQDVLSQKATKAARSVQTWTTIVVIVMVSGLFYIIGQRNDAIDDLQLAAARIERAATNTELVLLETIEAQRTPEAVKQTERVRQALRDIETIRRLLCELPELAEMPSCNE